MRGGRLAGSFVDLWSWMFKYTRERLLESIARLGLARPWPVFLVAAGLMVMSGSLIPTLQVTTSRYSLVSSDNPYQARLFRFFERFGYPDYPVLVVSGGTKADRRDVVSRLEKALESEPNLHGRVMARIDPEKVAEVLLLYRPEALSTLRPFLGPDEDLAHLVEGGIPEMARFLRAQIDAIAAADQLRMLTPYSLEAASDVSGKVVPWLAAMARALDAALAGKPAWSALMEPAGEALLPADQGLDRQGYLVGGGGSYNVIALFPDLAGDQVAQLRPLVTEIRDIRDVVLARAAKPGVAANRTGLPARSVDEHAILVRGLFQSSIAAAIAILLLFLAVFRSGRQTLMALVPLLFGIVLTLGSARILFGGLNLITSCFVAILLGLGIDFAVHLTARYNEALRRGVDAETAAVTTLTSAGPGILTGAATTIVAFLTTTVTEFTAFAQLGWMTALGLLYTLLATFFLVPVLLVWGTRHRMPVSPELPGMRPLAHLTRAAAWPTLVVALALAAGGGWILPHLSFNVRYFDFLPRQTESAIALRMIEKDGAMGPTFAFLTAETVEQAREMAKKARALDTVQTVQTATDLMPALDDGSLKNLRASLATSKEPDFEAMRKRLVSASDLEGPIAGITAALDRMRLVRQLTSRSTSDIDNARTALEQLGERLHSLPDQGQQQLGELNRRAAELLQRAWTTAARVATRGHWQPTDLPALFRHRFVSKDGKALALFVYPKGNIWDRHQAERFREELETLDPETSGTAINLHEHSRMVIGGFEKAAILAALLLMILLWLDFRSITDTALALAPLACGWLWMLGAMGLLGLRFDFANIVALPLVPGIGVATGVHLMHRCRQSAAEHGGKAQLEDLLRGTGAAVFTAGVTTVFGFAGLMVADYGGMISLGAVMSLGVASCLLGALHVLPAILFLSGRAE